MKYLKSTGTFDCDFQIGQILLLPTDSVILDHTVLLTSSI
jgi:hypothetical protein